jgi:hypothetical protein
MKIITKLLLVIIGILTVMSVIALVAIHWQLFAEHSLSISPEGINFYLSALGEYEALFTASVATLGLYFAFLQLTSAVDTYKDKIRSDHYAEWKNTLEVRLKEVEADEPYMGRQFIKLRYRLFLHLYEMKFAISTREQLDQVFELHFKKEVGFLEKTNERYQGMGEVYPDEKYSYSFDSFRFVFLGCIDNFYDEIEEDLKGIYLAVLPQYRHINLNTYQVALQNYRR